MLPTLGPSLPCPRRDPPLASRLRRGKFGTVRTAVCRRTGSTVAVKSIMKSGSRTPAQTYALFNEIAIMKKVGKAVVVVAAGASGPHPMCVRVCVVRECAR